MSASDAEQGPLCPVCQTHTLEDSLMSQGVVLTAVEAYLKGDSATIAAIYESLGKYDGHTAMTMYAMLLLEVCDATGVDPLELVAAARRDLDAQIIAPV